MLGRANSGISGSAAFMTGSPLHPRQKTITAQPFGE
jgi:hypothetical protein